MIMGGITAHLLFVEGTAVDWRNLLGRNTVRVRWVGTTSTDESSERRIHIPEEVDRKKKN